MAGTTWEFALFLENVTQEIANYTQLDERGSWFYEAVGVTEGMLGTHRRLRSGLSGVPKGRRRQLARRRQDLPLERSGQAPVAQFWSFSVYDNETRCLIDSGSYPDRSSRDDIVKNADGSVDLYFGPKPPVAGQEKNWIRTLPAKGWFTYFRLYGPTQPFFDRNWTLNDIEEFKA